MPKQSRGFWCCSYCEQAFDQYGEAEYHERHECTAVARPYPTPPFTFAPEPPPSTTTMVSSTAVDPIPPWHHHAPPPPPPVATPTEAPPYYPSRYSKAYPEESYGRGMVAISDQSAPQRPMMIPYESKLTMPQQRPPYSSRTSPPPQQQLRYLPILGSTESSTLIGTDELACRSLEFFEIMGPDLLEAGDAASATKAALSRRQVLQVGIRCAFCAEAETTTESYIFPANTRSVGDSIRHAGLDHLIRCPHYPNDYKRQIQDVLWNRNDQAASGQAESEEDVSQRRTLIDFCHAKCEQVGIIDRHPIGMIFANSSGGDGSGMGPPTLVPQQQQQQYTERAFGGRPHSATAAQQQQYGISQSQQGQGETREEESSATTDALESKQQHYPQQNIPPHFQGPPSFMPHAHMMTHEFPFYFDQSRWVCKYCAHVPPSYRDAQYFWIERGPPPPHFMDYHLSICREYQRSMIYEQSMQATVYGGRDATAQQQQAMFSPPYNAGPGWEQSRSMEPTGTPQRPGTDYQTSPDVLDSPYSTPPFHRQLPRAGRGDAVRSHQMQHRDPMSTSSTMIRTPMQREPPPPHRSSSNVDEMALMTAIEHLEALDERHYTVAGGNILRDDDRLVVGEDRLLLTDYFYYLMKQLRPVRFSEADRRTRGGKREKVKVGYGGLQCIHCIDVPNSRKFFWSNVDRLANSFAEIPTHVLKCRRCPQPTKDALIVLKNRHAEQMSRLSRGSQKVFFRRMWRRLHQDDPTETDESGTPAAGDFMSPMSFGMQPDDATRSNLESMRPPPLNLTSGASAQAAANQNKNSDISPSGTSGSEESAYFLQRPAKEAAKALVDASMQSGPPTPSSRVLLAIPEDREWLSDTDCFVRRQLEVFCATAQDVEAAMKDRKYPIKEGQVGIRCIHCAMTENGYGARGPAVAYPFSISGLFEAAREIERTHLGSRENLGSRDSLMITCENLPLSAKEKLESLKGAASSLSSVLRKYFVLAAKALGLRDTVNGIRAGAEPIPIGSQAPVVFSDSAESIDEIPSTPDKEKIDPHGTVAISRSSVKRKADDLSLPPSEQTSQKQRRTVALLKDDDEMREGQIGHGISILAGAATTDQETTVAAASQTTSNEDKTESSQLQKYADV